MDEFFADPYYYLARLNQRDAAHARAIKFSQTTTARVVTTAWVLTEVADALCKVAHRQIAVQLYDSLVADALCTIVPADQSLFERGWHRYRDRSDKSWSLTDCISFAVMQDRGISEALTADRHFEQAGFVAILREGLDPK